MKTKVISLLLCLVMALSLVPAALAEGETVPAPRLTLNGKAASAKEDVPAGEAALNVENAQDAAILWEKETEELNEKNEPIWQELGRSATLTLTINEGETLTLRCTLTQPEKDAVVLPLTLKGVAPVAEEAPAEEEAQQPAESPLPEADATAQPETEPSVEPSAEPSVEPSVEPTAEPKDYTGLYEQFMATQTVEELNVLWDSFAGEEEWEAFQAWLEANDKLAALDAHIEEITPEGDPVLPSIKRFTRVGPLLSAPVLRRANGLRAAANDSENNSGVVLNKKAEAVDGGYKITMEAYATGESTTIVSTEPVDIVLVLDVSGSMDDKLVEYKPVYELNTRNAYYINLNGSYQQVGYYGNGYWAYYNRGWVSVLPKTSETDSNVNHVQFYEVVQGDKKIDSLKAAVSNFIDSVNEKSPDSKIAIVKFAGDKSDRVGNDKYRDGRFTYNYSQIVSNLTQVSDDNVAALKSAINALSPAGATQANYGMALAQSIIDKVKDDGRKKVVIMFTDGEPTSQSDFEANVANAAISASKSIKDTGATVYTIGVFAGADGTPVNGWNDVSNTNKYMHLVSSNYKDATSMNNTGNATYPDGGKSYFLSAGSHSDLMSIFTQISQEVGGSSVKLDSSSYIQDTVTQQFTMPEGTDAVKFYTMDCVGENSFDESTKTEAADVTYTITDNTLKVTNFDFSANWCGTKDGVYQGKKLIIEFTVKEKADFLGGNNVLTNVGEGDGIYDKDGKEIGSFTPPTVNVPIKDVTVNAEDKNVYLLGAVTADQLKSGATVKVGDVALDLSKATDADKPYGLEKWQTEYVDITVKITDKDGKEVTDKIGDLRDDTTYTIQVTVAPKPGDTAGSSGTAATAQTGENTAKINVFKPEIDFKDSAINLGDKADYEKDNKVPNSLVWKHGNTEASEDMGAAPDLTFDYDPAADAFTKDTPVKVTVKIGNEDVTVYTTFYREECTFDGCEWKTRDVAKDGVNFIVHIKTFDLTITKIGAEDIDENQSFIFNVTGPDYSAKVVIYGNGSVTIKGLKVGEYTVTEETGWSWRYEPDNDTGSQTVTAAHVSNGKATVTFHNNRKQKKWLGGDAYARNLFSGKSGN